MPFTAECILCGVLMPYSSMTYLDQSQLTRYRLTDPCTVTCTAGYTGDFCQNQVPFFSSLPMGPWNQAGYYTGGSGLLKTMSTSASSIDYIQYTKKDSTLIGILYAMTIVSSVVEIALYSRTVKPVMTSSYGGSFDSLLVRNGVAYLGRTTKIRVASTTTDYYDVVVLSSTYSAQSIVTTSGRVGMMEIFKDKGTLTVFAYLPSTNTLNACYPDGNCFPWATVEISGMACGADCPSTIYASSFNKILSVRSTGYTMLRDTGSAIYCLTGISTLNVLLYKSTNTIYQHNLATQTSSNIALGTTDVGIKRVCSLDVSELNNQILIVQDGVIRTLEAVQLLCGYGLTSQSLQANSLNTCVPCPAPPDNAYWIEGSALCEWLCLGQFMKVGSKCIIAQTVVPCAAFYVLDVLSRLCVPSLLPWVAEGQYVTSVQYGPQRILPGSSSPYITAVVGTSTLIQISPNIIYVSRNSGSTWTASVSFTGSPGSPCAISTLNRYYYVSSNSADLLWTAFYYGVSSVQHCLWALDASSVASQGTQLTVLRSWSLRGKLCAATGDLSTVYLLLCGTHSISSAQMLAGSTPLPFAGGVQAGYLDSSLRISLFQFPSSMVLYDSRLYVTDTGNCVIREVDILRDTVNTVAGTGLCQRIDGAQRAALVAPNNLTYTAFPGIFLFVDKYASESNAVIRQFHVPTCTVQTVRSIPSNYYSDILAVDEKVMVRIDQIFVLLYATPTTCPAGTSSWAGGALTVSGCINCGNGLYSDTGTCKNCSTPSCALAGQMLVPCQVGIDAVCGLCTNRPAGNTQYIGPSAISGTSAGGGDCPWAYTPPCPAGYYAINSLCSSCPAWTTSPVGSTLLRQCTCLGNGQWTDDGCIVPASLIFPILASCSAYAVDSPGGICPCESGEYIQQINPKICESCQQGFYSTLGISCVPCPNRTESSLDRTTCRCADGLSDVSVVTASMPQCVCGPGKAFINAPLTCVPCEENKFNTAEIQQNDTNPSSCQWCEQGTFSGSGVSVCSQCPFSTYRIAYSPLGCQDCPAGMYATDTQSYSCIDCSETCSNGMKETICPTDATRLICSECTLAVRANSNLNGGRDCATSCYPGYFELDGECVLCTVYDGLSCDKGSLNVQCSSYADAACIPCVNSSMPLNYAVWKYSPLLFGGSNAFCEWECEAGYIPTQTPLPEGVPPAWECALAGAWSVWDLFTI
jgi:hypothetical protein